MAELAAPAQNQALDNLVKGIPENLVEQMVEAGVQFGHRASRWNPKMKPFIFAKRNLIHVIDLKATVRGLLRTCNFLEGVARTGGDILLVGTKWQAQDIVRQVATTSGMHFVINRWLGGTLTNHATIRSRLKRLDELEGLDSTGQIDAFSKKMQVRLKREKDKVFRNLEGIRNMEKLPQALLVVDARREVVALQEATRLGIATLALIDTDSDPDFVDVCIPANDDAHRSIELLLTLVGQAVQRGRELYKANQAQRARADSRPAKPQPAPAAAGALAAPAAAAAPVTPPAPQMPKGGVKKFKMPGAPAAGSDPAAPAAPAGDATAPK